MLLEALGALEDNYIWLLRDGDGRALVVDPGDADAVLRALDGGPPPHAILLTHHHNDHIGAVPALLACWPGTPVIGPDDARIHTTSQTVGDGDHVTVGPWQFQVLGIPGHTLSHIAFYCADAGGQRLLFCGDTLFSLGCGRMFEGTAPQMHASLMRLATLPGDTRVCCGHEYTLANATFALATDPDNPQLQARATEVAALRAAGKPTLPSLLADERACNPFLRCAEPALHAAAKRHTGTRPAGDVAVFAALRQWKDGFRA